MNQRDLWAGSAKQERERIETSGEEVNLDRHIRGHFFPRLNFEEVFENLSIDSLTYERGNWPIVDQYLQPQQHTQGGGHTIEHCDQLWIFSDESGSRLMWKDICEKKKKRAGKVAVNRVGAQLASKQMVIFKAWRDN